MVYKDLEGTARQSSAAADSLRAAARDESRIKKQNQQACVAGRDGRMERAVMPMEQAMPRKASGFLGMLAVRKHFSDLILRSRPRRPD